MDRSRSEQKKKVVMNYVYAALIGLLVVGCAVAIALISGTKVENTSGNVSTQQSVEVSAPVYTVPMKNATVAKDYSSKELQYNDTLKQWEIHKAIDFVATDDLQVYAITDGTVSNVYSNYLEGTVIEITHSNGLVSIYKSLDSDVKVSVGDKVKSGQVIATAGETMAQESNVGKHLHLEMKLNGAKVDPNNYIDLGTK